MAQKYTVLRALCTLDGIQYAEGDIAEMDEKNASYFNTHNAIGLYIPTDREDEVTTPVEEEKPKPKAKKRTKPAAPTPLDLDSAVTPDPRVR